MDKSWLLRVACCGLIFCTTSGSTLAADYTFKTIADSSSCSTCFIFRHPSINDSGTVVFSDLRDVFTGTGGALTNITAMLDGWVFSEPSINNDGTVAFVYDADVLYTSSGGVLTAIADTSYGSQFTAFDNPDIYHPTIPHPSINNYGSIAFWARSDVSNNYDSGIFKINNGAVEFYGYFGFLSYDPDINDSGTVVMFTEPTEPGYSNPKVWVGNNESATEIINKSSFPSEWDLYSIDDASINNDGIVVFSAIFNNIVPSQPWDGIYTSNGGAPNIVVDNTNWFGVDGLSFSWVNSPSINDKGTVAFLGNRNNDVLGIYTGPDPIKDAVIEVGDELAGSIVTNLSIKQNNESTKNAINRYGQITFLADLADGRDGVFVATPITSVTLDIDEDGQADALTDGLLVIRYLFGFRGDVLINSAVSPTARWTLAAELEAALQDAVGAILDVDGDGQADALTDGLLLMRYLFGFRGAALVDGAVASNAVRSNATTIEEYIFNAMP